MPDVQPLSGGDPRRLGGYELTGRLGEGGQGAVYLGAGPAGPVAIKLLHARLIEDEAARTRFVRDVEVTKRVARFCTAQLLDAGMAGDRPYIVSEYVPGPSLHQQVRQEGPRRGSALDRLAINTATALAAIHQAGIVHRDFKPGNVLMGPDGPVVIDFGIARALDATGSTTGAVSQVVGTPAFMAPEQLAEGPIGPHTDLFSWAITMSYAANGMPAFGNESIPKLINRILHEEPDLGALDGRLRGLVAACLTKDPARRPTARGLMDELMGPGRTAVLTPPSVAPGVSSAAARTPGAPGSRKRRAAVAGLVAGLVAALAGAGAVAATRGPGREPQATVAPPSHRASGPVQRRTPSPSRTPSRPPVSERRAQTDPYTPRGLCGAGFRVIDRHALGGATLYLLYNGDTGVNCAVTMVPTSTGRTAMSVTLQVKAGRRAARAGAVPFYAGPVRLPARGRCVRWAGSWRTVRWTSGWTHCGR